MSSLSPRINSDIGQSVRVESQHLLLVDLKMSNFGGHMAGQYIISFY
jgi:hypothetical protein